MNSGIRYFFWLRFWVIFREERDYGLEEELGFLEEGLGFLEEEGDKTN